MTIKEAFAEDGFTIVGSHQSQGTNHTGYVAENTTAINNNNGKPKRAYYLEGSAYEMGYQMGVLGNEDIRRMVTEFPHAAISQFLSGVPEKWEVDLIVIVVYTIMLTKLKDFDGYIPDTYVDEAKGIVDGVRSVHPLALSVTFDSVWVLNVGFDILVAFMSDPMKLIEEIIEHPLAKGKGLKPTKEYFRMPHFCNAYSAFDKKKKFHYFGRDWMFNAGNVMADCACLIIANPSDGRKPLVYAAAPSLVGAALAMNNDGVAMGVDMVSAANSDFANPGFNSILLVRDTIHQSASGTAAVDNITSAKRGATFIYPLSDGTNDESYVVEAGLNTSTLDPYSYVEDSLKSLLPDASTLAANSEPPVQGLYSRNQAYAQGMFFIDKYNKSLFEKYGKTYPEGVWQETGFIFDKPYNDPNAFGLFYFAPLRQNTGTTDTADSWSFQLVTNAWLNPSMNLCSMSFWPNLLAEPYYSDFQWRYDLLNTALRDYKKTITDLTMDNAWDLINFISPVIGYDDGKGHNGKDYYTKFGAPWDLPTVTYKDSSGKEQTTWRVDGMTNVCDLKALKLRSLYGTYADNYVEITLSNYIS